MKVSKAENAAVSAAEELAKKAQAELKRLEAKIRKLERRLESSTDVWHQATKILVPAWFGQNSVEKGFKLGETFSAAGVLALVAIGKTCRESEDSSNRRECEVGMQMRLRPSGFDREEARDLAQRGFSELRLHKLIRPHKRTRNLAQEIEVMSKPQLEYFVLSAKGQKWFDLIERSAGCADMDK